MTTPSKGFYYHYKHDGAKGDGDHAYEVIGVARHSEEENYVVVYRPLYENDFLHGVDYCVRPLTMFMETIEKEGKTIPRFARITDASLIERLSKIRDTMYV